MRLKIQLFSAEDYLKAYDDEMDYYKNEITKTQNDINNLSIQKQADLDAYNENYNNSVNQYNDYYNNQLSQYADLQKQQQDYIDQYAETQKETQQKQTDYNISLINQNKEEAAEETNKELGDSYIDYLKGINQYGGDSESLATSGLINSGYSESSRVAMNITYQNRVATAKSALQKANTDYDNQIQQALLSNDSALAEIALNQMQQSYQLALDGFNYTSELASNKITYMDNLNQNKLNYQTELDNTYYNRQRDLQSSIDSYNEMLADLNTSKANYQNEVDEIEREYQEWLAEFQEEQRQFNASLAEEQRQYNTSNSTSSYTDTATSGSDYGNSSATTSKSDYYFSNGYQPRYIDNTKLSKSEKWVASNILTASECSNLGIKQTQNIWQANGNYYVWVGGSKQYQDVTDMVEKAKSNGKSGGSYCITKSLL